MFLLSKLVSAIICSSFVVVDVFNHHSGDGIALGVPFPIDHAGLRVRGVLVDPGGFQRRDLLLDLVTGEEHLAELPAHEIVARTVYLDRADKVTEEFRLEPNCGAIDNGRQAAATA